MEKRELLGTCYLRTNCETKTRRASSGQPVLDFKVVDGDCLGGWITSSVQCCFVFCKTCK